MKLNRFLLVTCLAAMALQTAHAADRVGVRTVEVPSAARGANLKVTVWYPAAVGGTRVLVGNDRLLKGTEAWKDAPLSEGPFPLLVVSHGSGGGIANLDWIATRLAEAGFVVAGPNHPGTTRGDSTPADTTKIWQRPADLSDVITALTTQSPWSSHVDTGRIGAFGFSLGGHTVLATAGGRVKLEAYARYCENNPMMPDCVWFASGGVDLRKTDKALFEQSNRDPRIKSVVAIDPSIAPAFTVESLRAVAIPVHIINLGNARTIPVAVKFDRLASEIPDGDYKTVDDAVHLSFLAECQPGAHELLKATGDDDPICDDAKDSPKTRADINAEVAAMMEAAFLRDLGR
ncbi:alpha/beta hydrolase family protein [Microvirga terricola]|uniref:Prolyl oligopeptidase family serine peptidase n=1 Tax=Microvirga terricola TaxID=2719797 RepID=A0ABX0VAD2_9HYPH|nr:CocE/NonD family hydrolase [Microvirga terricola]NIX75645.1 prolyl oligopeptidase family serine peptidase [Microvirga terricola]